MSRFKTFLLAFLITFVVLLIPVFLILNTLRGQSEEPTSSARTDAALVVQTL